MITGTLIIEQLLNGLVLGCMYAAVASGLTLIWGTMKMLNFAHGEFFMLGGYTLYFAFTTFGVPVFASLVLAVVIVFFLGGLTEKVVIHPLLDRPGWELSPLIVTVGVSIFCRILP